ncbi:MAG TPA: nuclear transport factor 2 family protein [Nevskiaceae bacterium]|nr:nuclear transport factor 2 family protein [Nevskiaceae bacterium]
MRVTQLLFACALLCGCTTMQTRVAPDRATLEQQVRDTEAAFARSMAQRDFEAFKGFLSDEAVFFSGSEPLRGRAAIERRWQHLFEGKQAPFSWQPDTVQVLDSGTLALSSGPVYGPDGKQTATFNSIWRRDADGVWRVIFDKGCSACPCADLPHPTPSHKPMS